MAQWNKGDFVEMDGLLAVVVGTQDDPDVPEDHVALWFGDPQMKRVSEGGAGNARPEVWLVPADRCSPAQPPIYKH